MSMEAKGNDHGALKETPLFHFDLSRQSLQETNATELSRNIRNFGTFPITVLGVALNTLVLLIWNLKEKRQSIIFLFKALAVADIFFLVLFDLWWYVSSNLIIGDVLSTLTHTSQYILVNITLLIGVWRWIFVFRAEQSRVLLSDGRARLAVGIIIGYCMVLSVLDKAIIYTNPGNKMAGILSVVVVSAILFVPATLLVVLTAMLLHVLHFQPSVAPDMSSTGNIHLNVRSPNTPAKIRRLTFTILCMSLSTFVSYVLTGVSTIGFEVVDDPELEAFKLGNTAVSYLFYAIHSTIPFFFYFCFMHKFRNLCLLKFVNIYTTTGHYAPTIASETEPYTGMLGDTPDILSPQYKSGYRQSLVVVNEEGVLTVSRAPSHQSSTPSSRFFIHRRSSPCSHLIDSTKSSPSPLKEKRSESGRSLQ